MLVEGDANVVYKSVEVAGCTASCIDYNVSRSSVSVHLPLNRVIAALLVQTVKVGEPLSFLVDASESVSRYYFISLIYSCMAFV